MKRFLLAALFIGSFSPAYSDIVEYKTIEPMPILLPLEKIEETSIWRNHCKSNTKEFNNWIERYLVWLEKTQLKDKNVYYIAGAKKGIRQMLLRDLKGCDCLIEKRVVALDTLSKKAADALLESQYSQCMSK